MRRKNWCLLQHRFHNTPKQVNDRFYHVLDHPTWKFDTRILARFRRLHMANIYRMRIQIHWQIRLCYENVFFIVYCRFCWSIDSENLDFLMCLTELQAVILYPAETLAGLQASDEHQKSVKHASCTRASYGTQFNDQPPLDNKHWNFANKNSSVN